MTKRDKALLNKISAFYLQYTGVIRLNELLGIQKVDIEIEKVNKNVLNYIRLYVAYIAVKEVLESAKEALKDKLTYRELSVEYANQVLGQLDVDRTILVLPQKLYSYYTYREGMNAPEYRVFGTILRSVYEMATRLLKGYEIINTDLPEYFNFIDNFWTSLNELKEKYFKLFPGGYFRGPIYTDPQWLIRAYKAYEVLKKRIEIGTRPAEIKEKEELVLKLKFLLWRLYEIYVFYLLASLLESEGYKISKRGEKYEATKDSRTLYFYFNSSLEASKLRSVDNIVNVKRFRGKPDVSLSNNYLILFECKYSSEPSYITLGRFKIMAYTYEYDPTTAILVYPGLGEDNEYYDEEELATSELDKVVEKEGFIEFQYNGKKLYMMKIDPIDSDYINRERLKRVLENLV
ncbi:hypothetical protein DJ529_11065 [Sulfolobus sp. C3]|nr:hypothetical protein DJ529_11065 [Sulfolobus sp. C3]